MKLSSIIFIAFLIHCYSWGQEVDPDISFHIPSIQQEATSIWRTINDIDFFEQQGYSIHLPQDPLIDELVLKSKNNSFGNEDFSVIYELLESKVFEENSYRLALDKVNEQESLINNMIQQLVSSKEAWNWPFNIFEHYKVVFTLYGSGGSYDPESGIITLFTTKEGNFKNYKNPANTIIHEIVHLGIEHSIVMKHNLSHPYKERVVDKIVYLMFSDVLPNYKIQEFGELSIDDYLIEKEDLVNLSSLIGEHIPQD